MLRSPCVHFASTVIGRATAAGYDEYAPYLFSNIDLSWNGPEIETLRSHIWQDFHYTPDLMAAGKLVGFLPDRAVNDFALGGSSPHP